MDEATAIVRQVLSHAGLGVPDSVRLLGQGVHNNGYYARVGGNEYCVRIARYVGKRGLLREADALGRLPAGIGPQLVYISTDGAPINQLWGVTTYIAGRQPARLSIAQLRSFGSKLAQVHAVAAPKHDVVDEGEVTGDKTDLWNYLLWVCRNFYDPNGAVKDERLEQLLPLARAWFGQRQATLALPATKVLLHKDLGVGNCIVQRDEVFIIDWEDREFGDPMSDFATGFWDIRAAGRMVMSGEESEALYAGYAASGGVVDEERIRLWVVFDKLVVALFYCNRLHEPKDDATNEQLAQYQTELDEILASLQKVF